MQLKHCFGHLRLQVTLAILWGYISKIFEMWIAKSKIASPGSLFNHYLLCFLLTLSDLKFTCLLFNYFEHDTIRVRMTEKSRISSTFYEQLLSAQIPKAQKTVKLSVFLHFRDIGAQKPLIEYWWNWPLVCHVLFEWPLTTGSQPFELQVPVDDRFLSYCPSQNKLLLHGPRIISSYS